MTDVKLSCKCGEVQGRLKDVTPKSGNRLICYCKDCRKFSNQFEHGKELLDEFGGSEAVQVAPSTFRIDKGMEHVACMRLTPKGMNRWYTSCCDTPIGTVPKPTIPFIGLLPSFIAPEHSLEQTFGPVIGTVYSEQAQNRQGNNPHLPKSSKLTLAKVAGQILLWKVIGKSKPNLFFDATGRPIVKPLILNQDA
ncbi:hypothetical protein ST37_14590 [Vibrio sp. qd031]|uniref:DUF6151 family protein n=1 Tax=Vibrio sp. qd031 TaxID=1603038 RepID=UPI000A0FADA5|nr:DUF6151 family protein [Vibrio sp. qd031]ORT49600.1 hypothetical protein ST37_14590 [Vibrio sp. qd031]